MTSGHVNCATAVCRRAAGVILVLAAGLAVAPSTALGAPDAIQVENSLPGDSSWVRTEAPASVIDGYASEVSVLPGGTVHLHVSTQRAGERYRVMVYRLGWYGGKGGRRVACVPSCTGYELGNPHTAPPEDSSTGERQAGFPVTDTLQTGSNWVSGYYFAELVLVGPDNPGTDRVVPFVVRAPPGNRFTILAQAAVNTLQAYNSWGGRSLYGSNPAVKVSFNRPYNDILVLEDYELPFVRFAEREGYDLSYTTDVDTDADPTTLLGHRLVISLGHDEYWTKTMRDAFESLRTARVNLAFIGADIADWQMRYEDGRRTIVEYRSASKDPEPDPALKTVKFRDLSPPRPQCELLGEQFQSGIETHKGPTQQRALAAVGVTDPWFANTGFGQGAALPGSVGDEWDTIVSGCNVPHPTLLFEWQGKPANADTVRYTASSGARIFSSGTLQFTWTLDQSYHSQADPRAQQFMRNVLDDLGGPPPRSAALPPAAAAPLALSKLSVRSGHLSGRAVRHRPKAARRFVVFGVTVSAPAKVTFTVTRSVRTRRTATCRHRRGRRGARSRCTRYVPFASFSITARAGANSKRFVRRIGRHRLRPGSYLVSAVAVNAAGQRSASVNRAFVLPRRF